MTSNQRNWSVFAAAAGITGVASAAYLSLAGITDDNIRLLLRLSARIAFLVLLVIFVARPLRQLIVTPATAKLLKNRRLLGIAFAGIHTAHLALILYRADRVPDFEFNVLERLPGVATYLIILLMLITSFDRPARAMGRKAWKILHKVGLYWIVAAFIPTLLPESLEQLRGANGFLILLTAVAVSIRLTAFFAKRQKTR